MHGWSSRWSSGSWRMRSVVPAAGVTSAPARSPTRSRPPVGDDSTWLGIGYTVGDAGFVLLIVAMILSAVSVRRPERQWPIRAVTGIAGLYLIALLVAMFAMSGKPGS